MTVRKPFEQHLYDKYDNPAKSKLIELLISRGHDIKNVAENYYADVVSEKDGTVYHSEAEVKTGWEDTWPVSWTEIRIPERKSRLLAKYKGNVSFFIFNNSLSKCWHIKGSQMTDDTIRVATGKNIREGEMFFHIDYHDAELIPV